MLVNFHCCEWAEKNKKPSRSVERSFIIGGFWLTDKSYTEFTAIAKTDKINRVKNRSKINLVIKKPGNVYKNQGILILPRPDRFSNLGVGANGQSQQHVEAGPGRQLPRQILKKENCLMDNIIQHPFHHFLQRC